MLSGNVKRYVEMYPQTVRDLRVAIDNARRALDILNQIDAMVEAIEAGTPPRVPDGKDPYDHAYELEDGLKKAIHDAGMAWEAFLALVSDYRHYRRPDDVDVIREPLAGSDFGLDYDPEDRVSLSVPWGTLWAYDVAGDQELRSKLDGLRWKLETSVKVLEDIRRSIEEG